MTEGSAPWDHGKGGHANPGGLFSSTYESVEWANIWSLMHASDDNIGYVLPDVDNNLEVLDNNPDAMNVIVKTGAAFVHGRLYRSTAQETLTIATADATNPRIDRVVLRVTTTTGVQSIILAVITGTPAATPSMPALTQNATTWEVPLAHIWVAATVTSIAAPEVHDERVFYNTAKHAATYGPIQQLVKNSEYLACEHAVNVLIAPWSWVLVGSPEFDFNATIPALQPRGIEMEITATGAADEGVSQVIQTQKSKHIVVKVALNVTAGDVAKIVLNTRATAAGANVDTYTKLVRRTGSWIEETIHITIGATEGYLQIQLLAANSTDVVKYGQCLCAVGFIPGAFRVIDEALEIGARVFRDNTQTILNNTPTAVSFNQQVRDTDGIWAVSPNPTRLTAQMAGIYQVEFNCRWATTSATGIREIRILKNGTSIVAQLNDEGQTIFNVVQELSTQVELAVGEYVEAIVFQLSTANLDILAASDYGQHFSMQRLSNHLPVV